MRKKSRASGCSDFIRRYCCMAGVWGRLVVLMGTREKSGFGGRVYASGRHAMHLLAIDTTTRWGSVALLRDGEVRGEVRFVEDGGGHSRTVLPAVELLLRAAGLAPPDVEAYAVALGPGSFTGVRVGISTVQGLVLGSGRPALGLSSLEGL